MKHVSGGNSSGRPARSGTRQNLMRRAAAAAAAAVMSLGTGLYLPQDGIGTAQAASSPITDFTLADLKMTDPYCTNAFSKEMAYLLSFDTERLLCGFRENAKLSTNGAKRYAGWENTLIAGHTVGHYLSACAQAYLNPLLTADQRSKLDGILDRLLSGMLTCQQNSKGRPGFLWAGQVKDSNNVEKQFDLVQQGKTNIIDESWVPWYTMHKLVQGLVDVYCMTGKETAKTIASALGDWTYNRCSGWNQQTHNTVLSIEYGGMNDCLYQLYAITGKDTHAVAAHYFDETNLHERVLAGGQNVLDGRHANTTIPKFIGALRRYQVMDGRTLNGEKIDASRYLKYAEAFWDMVVTHHTYITGGNSEWEHFGKDDILDAERTNCNCETCNSYNMLKLSRELYKITGDKKYMDFYEGTYYNSILSSQNPESGMTTYFQPMATGYFKVYSSPYDSFWCCTGSGMESFTKLGDTIYMHSADAIYVNMYQSSEITWAEKNLTLKQVSRIPESDTAVFTVSGSGSADLRLRIPQWKAGNMTVKRNGASYSYTAENGYAVISGVRGGDEISVKIPMEITAYALPDNKAVYGFKYGPVVLSAELGRENMQTGSTGMWVTVPKEQIVSSQNITLNKQGQSVASFMAEINDHFTKDADALRFTLNDTNQKLVFTPHYLQYQQRYGIYWKFLSNGTVIDERPPRAKITVTDTVQPGYGQYENDELHSMLEWKTVGVTNDSTYRYAEAGGYFAYQMEVDPDAPFSMLSVRFRRSDNGKTIRIRVGDTVLYAGTLANEESTAATYDVRIPIPEDVFSRCVRTIQAGGRDVPVLDVTFSSDDGKESAKVCDFIYMNAVRPRYEYDSSIAYFVDCGDQDVTTLTGSDKLGWFNSVTEQLMGADEVSGMRWGLIDNPYDQYGGASRSGGIYTSNTWPNESAPGDGAEKNVSFRYTKNQYENNIARHLDYGFTLPDGEYTVEMSFRDPWGCSKNPRVYANFGKDNQKLIASDCPVDGSAVRGTVTVSGGYLELNFRSDDKAINLDYIIIRFADGMPYSTVGMRGDVNLDGSVTAQDASALRDALLKGSALTWEQGYAADLASDFSLNAKDLTVLKRRLLK